MKIISLYNMKGGVGKTTICVNLAYLASAAGFKTLLLDIDPQGAASFYLRVRASKKFKSKTLVKGGKNLEAAIKESDYKNLDIIPASISLRNLDLKLNSKNDNSKQLRRVLKRFKNEYDIVFIDSPPNLTILSENILYASDKVIMPIIPTPLSLEALGKFRDFFKKKKYDAQKILLLISMMEKRKALHREILDNINQHDFHMLKTVIPFSGEIEKMGIKKEPLPVYSKSSPAQKSFVSVWNEIQEIVLQK